MAQIPVFVGATRITKSSQRQARTLIQDVPEGGAEKAHAFDIVLPLGTDESVLPLGTRLTIDIVEAEAVEDKPGLYRVLKGNVLKDSIKLPSSISFI